METVSLESGGDWARHWSKSTGDPTACVADVNHPFPCEIPIPRSRSGRDRLVGFRLLSFSLLFVSVVRFQDLAFRAKL